MSVWASRFTDHPILTGREGELISLRLAVEPRLLEELLESLAALSFPVNPNIEHKFGEKPEAVVEFPAYEEQLKEVRTALHRAGLGASELTVRPMLGELRKG
ncbi:MAG: hypothetical protein FJW20_08570 [Acidimicrobiia bacterium]|nr:hypothetical protein [Acidimicrobiia bacterium]